MDSTISRKTWRQIRILNCFKNQTKHPLSKEGVLFLTKRQNYVLMNSCIKII